MSTDLASRLVEAKDTVQRLNSEKSKLEGKVDEAKRRLKKDYGVGSVKEARTKINKLKKEKEQKLKELERLVVTVEQELERAGVA